MSRIGLLIFAKRTRLAMTCASVLLTAGCSLTSSTGTLTPELKTPLQPGESEAPFCLVAKPITYSLKADTPETVEQIAEHNAVGKALTCSRWRKAP